VDCNAQNGNVVSTLNNVTNITDATAISSTNYWLYNVRIFNASEMGKKYYKAAKHCHELIINELARHKRMRETAVNREISDEKRSLMNLLIQCADNGKEEIIEEIANTIGARTETIFVACGYGLALLGNNKHIQEMVMQVQQDILDDGILRPVRSNDLEQVGNCLLPHSKFSTIVAIFRNYIK